MTMAKVGEGNRRKMGELMNYKRHNPSTQTEKSYRYAMYRDGKLVSSTFSGGGLNSGK
jgi:hypothetical protein